MYYYNLTALLLSLCFASFKNTNAQLISGGATIFKTGINCTDIVSGCKFVGTCCSLSNIDAGGCQLTVLGGNCEPSGENCPWLLSIKSTSTDQCPAGDYDHVLENPASSAPTPSSSANKILSSGGITVSGSLFIFASALTFGL